MTITLSPTSETFDYDWLKDEIKRWIHRTDLVAQIPSFITLAESEINTDLRLRMMETTEVLLLATGERAVTLPDLFMEPLKLELLTADDAVDLTNLSPGQFQSSAVRTTPTYWMVDGPDIVLTSPADRDYALRLRYLQRLDIASTLTNDLLTNYHGLYLYGALMQASAFMGKDERVPQWSAMYENLRRKVMRREGRNRSMTTLRTEVPCSLL